MKTAIKLSFIAALLCGCCQTFTNSQGKKTKQFFPAKDRISGRQIDTVRFTQRAFSISDYSNKTSYHGKHRIIEPMQGTDVSILQKTKQRYYLYFLNPTCPASRSHISKLDSFARQGNYVMVVSLRQNYEAIDRTLAKTVFAQYPYYTIEEKKYGNILLRRQIGFIKDACSSCYDEYRDELGAADYLVIKDSTVLPLMDDPFISAIATNSTR